MNRRTLPALAAGLLVLLARGAAAEGIAKGPYLMFPTTSSVTVCWVSDPAATGVVTCHPASEAGGAAVLIEARENMPVQYHRVRLAVLQPYTRYRFQVECEGRKASGSFVTAAPPLQPFHFVAYGDNRTQPSVHAAVLAGIERTDPDFIINTGDQVANGTSEAQWDEFWHVTQEAFSHQPYFPCLGNHERGGAPYFRYFGVTAEYSFDYGNAHFVALDSNRPPSEHTAQEEWLKRDLAAHQKATWRIVFFHHTPYTCVDIPQRHVLAEALRARLEPIFLAEHVQLVVNGHDHCYQHHFAKGIHYIVTGGGGAPLYTVTPNTPYVKFAKSVHHFCELKVDGNTMTVRALEPTGAVLEEFTLHAST